MNIAEDIRRRGFRRWYERQLTQGFAYLAMAFLALIALLAGYESLAQLPSTSLFYATLFIAVAGAGVLTLVAWRRFVTLVLRAEQFAHAAECPQCKLWGRFEVMAAEPGGEGEPLESGHPRWLRVRCRRCGQGWRLG